MSHHPHGMPVGAFAAAAGVNVETIRFYQRKRLLSEPTRSYGSIRRYGDAEVARVKFIKSAQGLGFSLEEIAGLLRLEDGTHCDQARVMAEQKLEDVRSKLHDLRRMEAALKKLVDDCCASHRTISCPLIAALHTHDARQARALRARRTHATTAGHA
jgi:MerR family mercuric resistance operon transcriptional regulator